MSYINDAVVAQIRCKLLEPEFWKVQVDKAEACQLSLTRPQRGQKTVPAHASMLKCQYHFRDAELIFKINAVVATLSVRKS